jgi:hypothetical protein
MRISTLLKYIICADTTKYYSQYLAHPICIILFVPPSPPMNLKRWTIQSQRVFNCHHFGQWGTVISCYRCPAGHHEPVQFYHPKEDSRCFPTNLHPSTVPHVHFYHPKEDLGGGFGCKSILKKYFKGSIYCWCWASSCNEVPFKYTEKFVLVLYRLCSLSPTSALSHSKPLTTQLLINHSNWVTKVSQCNQCCVVTWFHKLELLILVPVKVETKRDLGLMFGTSSGLETRTKTL